MRRDQFWSERAVLVTGGTGFIGRWIVEELAGNGARVVVVVRDLTPFASDWIKGNNTRIDFVPGDLTRIHQIERVANEYEVDTCMHLGAQAVVGTANRSPLSTFNSNIKGTWNVLEVARNSRTIKGTILASSDKAYGEPTRLPITEDHPLRGSHPYDVSKSCSDLIGQAYYETYGVAVSITRCSNIYGGGDTNFSRLVPGVVRSALRRERPVIRSDGTPLRDYLYVSDAVDAYLLLGENLDRQAVRGQAFNFGTNSPVSVLGLTNRILELSGCSNLKPIVRGESTGEIQKQYLSSAKAKAVLGWAPRVSLDDGLKKTIDWYRSGLGKTPRW